MTDGPLEIITSVQRRRRWSASEKRQLVAASLEAGRAYRRCLDRPGSRQATAGAAADELCARSRTYRDAPRLSRRIAPLVASCRGAP